MVPFGNDVVVIDRAALIVSESGWVAVRDPLSVTRNMMFEVPAAVGVPVIAPVEAFNDRPAGKLLPTVAHVYGVVPPAAASVAE